MVNPADIEDLFADDDEFAYLGYRERIVQDPAVMVGKPIVRGTRIPVELILGWLSGNMDLEEFFAAYPHLTLADVQAAIAFARDAVRADYLQSQHQSQQRKDALAALDLRAAPEGGEG
ncbi:MAG: DUF433 domain-containing protein [Thermomicrobiales bacterium]|nr:DUF433 domain-containing protein [Thermomicrobiales bacterium]